MALLPRLRRDDELVVDLLRAGRDVGLSRVHGWRILDGGERLQRGAALGLCLQGVADKQLYGWDGFAAEAGVEQLAIEGMQRVGLLHEHVLDMAQVVAPQLLDGDPEIADEWEAIDLSPLFLRGEIAFQPLE